MRLVDPRATDLVAGFKRLDQFEKEYKTRQQAALSQPKVSPSPNRRLAPRFSPKERLLTLVTLVVCVPLVLITFLVLYSEVPGAAYGIAGISALGMLGITVFVFSPTGFLQSIASAPANPTPVMWKNWRARLNGSLPPPGENGPSWKKDSDEALQAFVRLLQKTQDDSYLLLYEVQPRHGDDIDLLVIGPKGIWLFEAKHWAGEVLWQGGVWRHETTHYATGGIPMTDTKTISQPPHKQWQRMVAETITTLQKNGSNWIWSAPNLTKIEGGLVFTHPTANYHIDPSSSFKWGGPDYWRRQLLEAPVRPEMTEYIILSATETVLSRHQALNRGKLSTYSMLDHANKLVQQADKKVKL